MLKREQRRGKRKRRNDDDDEDSEEDVPAGKFIPLPRDFDRGGNGGPKKTKKLKMQGGSSHNNNKDSFQHRNDTASYEISNHELKLSYWTGKPGKDPVSEDLKALRKSIGVNVRGNVGLCPPPLDSTNSNDIPAGITKVLEILSFKDLTAVQRQCIPAILNGANLLGIAPTGSGKTYTYGLPMISHILHHAKHLPKATIPSPLALILVPTRELAIQVAASFKLFWRIHSIKTIALYGGMDKEMQLQTVSADSPVHCAVATPGRLIDLVQGGNVSLARVSYLVLDEADRMLALGFLDQLDFVSRRIRPDRQTVLFSATFPGRLRDAAESWIRDAVMVWCNSIELSSESNTHIENNLESTNHPNNKMATEDGHGDAMPSTVSSSVSLPKTITQHVHVCASHKKPRLLIKCINRIREQEREEKVRQPGSLLIFCTKIKTLKFVEDFLRRQNVNIAILHGQLPQAQRERTLSDFRAVGSTN